MKYNVNNEWQDSYKAWRKCYNLIISKNEIRREFDSGVRIAGVPSDLDSQFYAIAKKIALGMTPKQVEAMTATKTVNEDICITIRQVSQRKRPAIRHCLQCGAETKNRKFCSQGCSDEGFKYARSIKETGECCVCGEARTVCLEFHHVGDKIFAIGKSKAKTLQQVVKELEKCILVCRNCHAVIHEQRSQNDRER